MTKKFYFNRRSGDDRRSGEDPRENPRLDLPHRRRRRRPDRRVQRDISQVLVELGTESDQRH
ncbi:MAG TPA: hypothetical protein VL027_03925 [Spongiibacteraceae bacterium]|jgi:hypothetical protein|nr:hypothetical protein [Spongiibacteraceae bacterium]HUH37076.1 hypothetical protein [Spongiibacteraceae bacterium]